MLKTNKAFSSYSVKDTGVAKEFYGKTLGLDAKQSEMGLDLNLPGTHIFIYESQTNKPADFTVLNLLVENVEQAVSELINKGIQMEQYDMPGIKTDDKGIASSENGPRAMAWFKDPDGNIISLVQE